MTALTRTQQTPTGAIAAPEALESLAREAHSVALARSVVLRQIREEPCTLADADRRIRILRALQLDEGALEPLALRLAEGMRPAGPVEIGKLLVILDQACPKTRNKTEMSGALMFDEVVIAAPSVLVLESAVRKLWRTQDWFPSIAQLLQAIREEEARWQYWSRCLSQVVEEHAQALAKLNKARTWLARTDEERAVTRQYRLDTLKRLRQQIVAGSADMGSAWK